jgi:hypothetical protein
MKKFLSAFILTIPLASLYAQEPADAIRFSWNNQGGTARTMAIGGAMGSLGGDITATFVNPAGLAFYRTGDFVLGATYANGKTKGNYFGNEMKESTKRFTWGTTGFVFGGGDQKKDIRNAAFSIAYNRSGDFNNNILYRGTNNQSSYSQKYLEEIQRNNIKDGNVLANNYPYGSSLAFNTFWIDTIGGSTNGNFDFQSRSAKLISSGLIQQNSISNRGGVDELALGVAVNLKDKFFFGGTFGVPILHYKRTSEFTEADYTENTSNRFNYAQINENLETTGVGVNLKLGMIYKPSEFWRLGFAFHTPTAYSLTDTYSTDITTDTENGQVLSDYSKDYTDGKATEFNYTYFSPYKAIGSISYVLREIQDVTKQRGFLTADVEYVNYRSSSFSVNDENNNDQSTKDYLKTLNKAIDNAYKGAINLRAGGELKFTTIMVRLGAAYYGNPYTNINGENGSRLNLSGGLGYRDKGYFIDLTYVYNVTKDVHYAYRLANAPYSGANLRTGMGNIYLTVGFKI